ncbi:MAG: hypothetical protein M1838_001581 [Thelocarpon superellum]|nr:MAG: hypothetical protein M1838_001581 [Thelocarpon superellum]
MSSFSLSRTMLRRSQFFRPRPTMRHNSTTSQATEAASKGASRAQATASATLSKASAGLSRVTSSAGPALSNAAQGAGKALKGIGGRTGRIISAVEALVPPTIYYSRVALELSKIVFHGQKMNPPSVATFQAYFQPIVRGVQNPSRLVSEVNSYTHSLTPAHVLNQIRNTSAQQLATVGVISAEVLGFFTAGEMLGRFKIVGYRGETGAHH